jgi:hypothetical protein
MSAKQNPHSVIRIPASLEDNFFRYWVEFLRPFHNLTNRQMDIFTCFIKRRHELGKKIIDSNILDTHLMGDNIKREIREECNISLPHFQVIMGELKKKKLIVDNKINPRFIPIIKEEDGNFKMMLLFDLK